MHKRGPFGLPLKSELGHPNDLVKYPHAVSLMVKISSFGLGSCDTQMDCFD